MEILMKKFWAILLFMPTLAFAQSDYPRDITYCWTLPTEYVDGTLIEAGELATTRIAASRNSGESILDQLVPVGTTLPGERMCFTFVGAVPNPGTYVALAYAITVDGASSDASNTSTKKFTGKPLPPQTFD